MSTENIILNIEELNNPHQWNGIKLEMTNSNENIIAKIDNTPQCCEVWGHNITYEKNGQSINTKLKDFIGAIFISAEAIEYGKNGKPISTKLKDFISAEIIEYDSDYSNDRYGNYRYGNDTCKVSIDIKIITDKGNIKIEFYNDHNGYYSHDVSIQVGSSVRIIEL